jgi:MOSC domain-containing protein YiiM
MPFHRDSSLAKLIDAPVRPGKVIWIGIRPARREAMKPLQEVRLDAGRGVAGDRYGSLDGARQVTLIQAESLAAIASHLGRTQVTPEDLRRNVVTQGINLLALKGRRFCIGDTVLEASGECHPCSRMEEIFGVGGYNAVRGLGGITARVIEGGRIAIDDPIVPIVPIASAAKSMAG